MSRERGEDQPLAPADVSAGDEAREVRHTGGVVVASAEQARLIASNPEPRVHPRYQLKPLRGKVASRRSARSRSIGKYSGVAREVVIVGPETTAVLEPDPPRRRASDEEIAEMRALGDRIERDVLTNLGIDPDISTEDLLKLPFD